jgi:hypothetical protein
MVDLVLVLSYSDIINDVPIFLCKRLEIWNFHFSPHRTFQQEILQYNIRMFYY